MCIGEALSLSYAGARQELDSWLDESSNPCSTIPRLTLFISGLS